VEELLMNSRIAAVTLCSVFSLAMVNAGRAQQPPVVPYSLPVQREVTDYQEYVGRTEAASSVIIRARVSGYLIRVAFKDGSEVRQGDLLFEIDPRPYQAALDQAMSQVALHESMLKLASAVYERDMALGQKAAGVVSQQQLDQDKAAVEEATARLRNAKAGLESVRLNLEFTHVTSPISGRIGRRLLDPGNLVKADETDLATVVASDPIHVNFEMDEATLLRIRRAANEGKIKPGGAASVFMRLADENDYSHQSAIDFINNQVNPATGTVTVRSVFPNPKPAAGERLLVPGMSVRLRLPIGQPHQALLVAWSALESDGRYYVYVIDAENKVQRRHVALGAIQPDGLRVVADGLKPEDRVVVGGREKLRLGMIVTPEKAEMPRKEADKGQPPGAGEKKP
jgi:multidrug efflux system membrane fusion protein